MSPTSQAILTLVASSDERRLTPKLLDELMRFLTMNKAGPGEVVWLNSGIAGQIPITNTSSALKDQLSSFFAAQKIDWALLPAATTRQKLLVADMDGTIVAGETLELLAQNTASKRAIADLTDRAMRGEIDFKTALRERVMLLAGLDISTLAQAAAQITLSPGAATLIHTMRKHGAITILVSGGFSPFIDRVAAELGFNHSFGNRFLIENGCLTGGVIEPVLDRARKAEILVAEARRLNIALHDTLAVGDGSNDLAMIEAAGLGVAYHARPVVVDAADAAIRYGDLTTLLYFQSYRRDEFVVA